MYVGQMKIAFDKPCQHYSRIRATTNQLTFTHDSDSLIVNGVESRDVRIHGHSLRNLLRGELRYELSNIVFEGHLGGERAVDKNGAFKLVRYA